jgi:hypothetical protein
VVPLRFELPTFDTINRAARRVRATLTHTLHERFFTALSQDDLARIDALFITDVTTLRTPWNELKADAANPTLSELRDLVARQRWLVTQVVGAAALADIPSCQAAALRRCAAGTRWSDRRRTQPDGTWLGRLLPSRQLIAQVPSNG